MARNHFSFEKRRKEKEKKAKKEAKREARAERIGADPAINTHSVTMPTPIASKADRKRHATIAATIAASRVVTLASVMVLKAFS